VKIGPVHPAIICLKGLFFYKETTGCTSFTFLKLRSCWTKAHQIYKSCSQFITWDECFYIRMANGWYCSPFRNAMATNKNK